MPAADVQADSRAQPVSQLAMVLRTVSLLVIAVSLLLLARHVSLAAILAALERESARLGAWAPLVFGLVYVLGTLLCFPASLLTITAGALFGLLLGTVVAALASTSSVALAFLIGRYLARAAVLRMAHRHPRLDAIDRAVSADGWKVVALLRLTPAVAFSLQNYLYGVTGIRFGTCVLTSAVAMLPGTLLYVYLGALGRRSVEATGSPAEWGFLAVGLLATVALTVYIGRLARKALRTRPGLAPAAGPGEAGPPVGRGRLWITPALVVAAALLAAGAVFAHVFPEKIEQLFPAPVSRESSLGHGPGRLIS